MTVNGNAETTDGRRAADAARALPARHARAHRHALGLRHVELRHLRRPARRRAGQVVHRPRRHGRRPRVETVEGLEQGGSSTRCRRASWPSTACSAASARPGDAHAPRRCWTATRTRPRRRSARRSAARSAGAPATRPSSARCGGPPNTGQRAHRRATGRRRPGPRSTTRRDRRGGERQVRPPGDGSERPIGFGRLRRKEDPRFIRGQGHYVDDVRLPGMLHGAILRSPIAHGRIVSIDTSAALAHPKVRAVITGADLAAQNLAWMPTLSYDVQAVLATDKVRFQGQEVAVRRRGRPLLRPRRARAHRRRVRRAPAARRRPARARPGRAR